MRNLFFNFWDQPPKNDGTSEHGQGGMEEMRSETTAKRRFLFFMLVPLVCMVTTAYFNYGFYHPDEYWQVLEFASYKLGTTDQSDLPWEFTAQCRSWLQPAVYYGMMKTMTALGVEDRFFMTFVLRLFTGLIGWLAILALGIVSMSWLRTEGGKRAQAFVLPLVCFTPFILCRTSSESLSCSMFTIAFALLLKGRPPDGPSGPRRERFRTLAAAGLFLGLAFEFRYQTGLMIASLMLWWVVIARRSLYSVLAVAAGAVAPLVACFFIDSWGYGEPVIPLFNYLFVNSTPRYGSSPFFAYFYLILANPMPFIPLFLLLVMIFSWLRQPGHAVTWVTLPFFICHCLIPHKEERFLFPMAILVSAMVVPALSPDIGRTSKIARWLALPSKRLIYRTLFGLNLFGLVFISAYPSTVESHIYLQRKIYEKHRDYFSFSYVDFNPYERWGLVYSFYKPKRLEAARLAGIGDLENRVKIGRDSRFFVSPLPFLDDGPESAWFSRTRLESWCFLPCASNDILNLAGSFMKASYELLPEHISWASIFEIAPVHESHVSDMSQIRKESH